MQAFQPRNASVSAAKCKCFISVLLAFWKWCSRETLRTMAYLHGIVTKISGSVSQFTFQRMGGVTIIEGICIHPSTPPPKPLAAS